MRITNLRRRNLGHFAAAVLLALSLVGCGLEEGAEVGSTEGAVVADDIYAKLKAAEGLLPPPTAEATAGMGVLDVETGEFVGKIEQIRYNSLGKPYTVKPTVVVNALKAKLQWSCLNRGSASFWVVANGKSATATAGVDTVAISVGDATSVSWSLHCAGITVSSSAPITHYLYGAGAFTVPALPITIVYEPPQNKAKSNYAQVTFGEQSSSVISLSSSTDTSTKTSSFDTVTNVMGALTTVASKVGAGTAATLLKAASGLMGSVETTTTEGTTVNSDSSLGLSVSSSLTITTNLRQGPGKGDVFLFYRDARIAWVMTGGSPKLMLLSHGGMGVHAAADLLQDLSDLKAGLKVPATTISKLDQTTLESLLKLDPFVPAVPFALPESRFPVDPMSPLIASTAGIDFDLEHAITATDRTAKQSYTTTLKDAHAGWLSALGIGAVTESSSVKTTITQGSAQLDTTTSKVKAKVHLDASAGESYTVEVYYDRVLGSFALKSPSLPSSIGVVTPLGSPLK